MLNNISFLNFKSNLQPLKLNKNQNNHFNITAPKLAPLASDTVSFKGNVEYRRAINNPELCAKIHDDAFFVNEWLKEMLHSYFDDSVYNEKTNPTGNVEDIQARVKTGDSIEEKISEKIEDAMKPENDIRKKIFSPHIAEEIKENIRDISGGRIVVKHANREAMDQVVDNLCKMILNERLVIDEIEHHFSPDKTVEPYFNEKQLGRICAAANKVRKWSKLPLIKVKPNKSKSGYMALHISIDSTKKPNGVGVDSDYKNFYSELQILGSDVGMLKDIEDFCYKLKKGMGIKSGDVAYSPFEKFFLDAYRSADKKYGNIQKNFQLYTMEAYKAQRTRKPSKDAEDNTSDWAYKFPTIQECGFEGKVPPILDFNILARIKRDCDELYYVEHHTEEILADINKKPKVTDEA